MAHTTTHEVHATFPANPQTTANRELLHDAGLFTVHLCGSPGSGKSTLIQATLRRLGQQARIGVIVAHLAADRDAAALQTAGARTIPLEVPALDPAGLHDALGLLVLGSQRLDLLFIEDAGQTTDKPPVDLGQSVRVAVFSVTGGDDKAAEFPQRVRAADLVLLTKTDLLSHVKFDPDVFRNDVQRLNSNARLIELSSTDDATMGHWIDWLIGHGLQARLNRKPQPPRETSEWWFG